MAETACFILIDGEMLIEKHQLAQSVDLPLTIKSGLVHLEECIGFNAIDLSDHPGNVLIETWGHLTAKVVSHRDRCTISPIFAPGRD